MNKKIIALLLTALLLAPFFPTTAFAAQTHELTTTDIDLSACADGDTILVKSGADVMISNIQGLTKNIEIVCEQGVTLHLYNVIIDAGETANKCALSFTGSRNSLILSGTNILISGANEPGIRVEIYNTLDIYDDDTGSEDYLYATGGSRAAGIGGGNTSSAGGIYIYRGNIVAAGGLAAAGIGSGADPAEEYAYIRIYGGTVNAKGGEAYGSTDVNCGAGIGGGRNCEGGTIIIEGGDVTAIGGANAAGIGGGGNGGGGEITISAGTVIASAPYLDDNITGGAAIGSGAYGEGGEITISGGTVIARGGQSGDAGTGGGAGIGGGYIGSAGTIFIYGDAQVTATGGEYAAGIGSGYAGNGGNITITGSAQVTATGSAGGAGIGGSVANHGCTVNISGAAQITATGNGGGAGIGGGGGSGYIYSPSYGGDGGDFNISGGMVTATGTGYGAGIGGGGCYNIASDLSGGAGNITLNGGTVYARHGELGGMDIGAGEGRTVGTLSLSDTGLAFLYNDSYLSNIITGYTHLPNVPLDSKNRMYGYPVSAGWESSSVLCYEPLTITYNANSSETYGNPPETQTVLNTPQSSFTASENTLSHTYLDFVKWNINAGGTGTDCHPGLDYYTNTSLTLYAIWSIRAQSIAVSESSISVAESGTYQLDATLSPDDSTDSVYWSTDDPTVAGVSQNGTVYGISEGTCTITATAGGKNDTCAVRVTERPSIAVTSVSLSRGKKTLYIGDVFALTATVLPDDATNAKVTWKSSDSSIASVNSSGVVTAHSEGSCTITATSDGESDSCAVTVKYKPAITPAPLYVESVKLTIDSNAVTLLYVGDNVDLVANVFPANAENRSVSWQSSDESVATVSPVGHVSAIGVGEAKITAIVSGISDVYNIAVKARDEESTPPSPTATIAPPLLDAQTISAIELPETIQAPESGAQQSNGLSALAIVLIALATLVLGAGGALLFVRHVINKK